MKKILIPASLFVLLIVGSVFAVTMENMGNYYQVNDFKIENGWNMVYWFDPYYLTGDVLESDIKVMYALDPFDQEYVEYYPENKLFGEDGKYNETEWSQRWHYFSNSAVWLYSSKAGIVSYKRYDIIYVNDVELAPGWNFVGITNGMVCSQEDPFEIQDFKGTCNFEKVCWWNPVEREWFCDLQDEEMYEHSSEGIGLAIKVSEDCSLEGIYSSNSIPALP